MKVAETPFQFMAASSLTRITGQRATMLTELLEELRRCSPASIFNHTFQTLQEHQFLTEGFSNDFAQWALAACKEPQLAERLASLDIRRYDTLTDLKADLVATLEDYLALTPEAARRKAFEPFYFCEAVTVVVPTQWQAKTLPEFCEAVRGVSVHTVYYHFVTARLREPLAVNDFSWWLECSLGLKDLGDKIEQIDIYTHTLEAVRQSILEETAPWLTV
jgi:hypothetical protein